MALEGTIKEVGLPDIFQLIQMQKRTGVLTLSREKEVVTVCFDKGQVVLSDEFRRSEQERLGAILLKFKLLSPQQLLKAIEIQKQTLQKLGFILVNNGFISQEQLKKALQLQVRETVFRLFRWEDGNFSFSQENLAYDENLYTPMPADFLVMEGIRRIDEWPLIKKKITSMTLIFARAENAEAKIEEMQEESREEDLDDILSLVDEGGLSAPPPEDKAGMKLSTSERVLFSMVDGRRTVEDLVDEGRLGEFETCKALFSLLSLGLVRVVGEVKPTEPKGRSGVGLIMGRRALAGVVALLGVVAVLLFDPVSLARVGLTAAASLREVDAMGDKFRLEKVKFALTCYYYEQGGYPVALAELVTAGYLEPGEITGHDGIEYFYLRERTGFSLKMPQGREK